MKSYSVDLHDSTKTFEGICRDHKTRMFNDAYTAMASSMSTTFSFFKILHGITNNFPNYDKAVFGRMLKGPYSEDLLAGGGHYGFYSQVPNFRSHTDHDDYSSNSGSVTKRRKEKIISLQRSVMNYRFECNLQVVVREWNSIDAMQFIYENRQGALAGNANVGQTMQFPNWVGSSIARSRTEDQPYKLIGRNNFKF
ncbi:hypothetical protein KP509_1Z149200 [Ceratopteris richardii]|nr:hypothetical protein KP509_1Z149200 [Ceratopteris richardii]